MTLRTQTLPPLAERVTLTTIERDHNLVACTTTFGQMADSLPDLLLVLNEHRQIVYANRAALDALNVPTVTAIYGHRPGEVLTCNNSHTAPGGCGTGPVCTTCGAVRAILSSLTGTIDVQDCRITRLDGSALDLQVHATPLQIGDRIFSIFVAKDVAAEKRRQALERIFFHDVLNTAGVILGYAELLQSGEIAEDEQAYENLMLNAVRLVDEISAQRELTLAEQNDLVVRPRPVDTLQLLQQVAKAYERHRVGRERSIVISPDAQPVELLTDGTLLRRVIGNMVKNALEAARPGQTVTLYCTQVGDNVAFSVHNPQHIPQAVQLQIFQRSFSTKGEGRGLGTYSMKLIGERYLYGHVSFVSSRAQGTTFTARFPLVWPLGPA